MKNETVYLRMSFVTEKKGKQTVILNSKIITQNLRFSQNLCFILLHTTFTKSQTRRKNMLKKG